MVEGVSTKECTFKCNRKPLKDLGRGSNRRAVSLPGGDETGEQDGN